MQQVNSRACNQTGRSQRKKSERERGGLCGGQEEVEVREEENLKQGENVLYKEEN